MPSEEKIFDRLLNETFENGVYLREQNLHLKYYQTPDQQVSKTWYLDQRATLYLCRSKGCKVKVYQTLRMLLSSRYQTWAACMQFTVGRPAEFLSNF